ncbi:ADP-ribosylglycohydrolase family protein [Streptomyces sp. NPDC052036]|uniref:ADP-ribosylglycohydrolase family protein n=1 Tax=Streptomyces sp. NPDC052036 TaxID=3155171 RepID=UPI00342E7FB0
MTRPSPTRRAIATVLGSTVGDALGAPFEFGPEGAFSARFPRPGHGGEMCGGGGWDPGEATDDTQRTPSPRSRRLSRPCTPAIAPASRPSWPPTGIRTGRRSNGAIWPCLGSAVWALRTTTSYEDAVRAAVDLGGDTDTVAAVTGGLAGAVYGPDALPERWTEPLHVPLPGFGDRTLRTPQLSALAGPGVEARGKASIHRSRPTDSGGASDPRS